MKTYLIELPTDQPFILQVEGRSLLPLDRLPVPYPSTSRWWSPEKQCYTSSHDIRRLMLTPYCVEHQHYEQFIRDWLPDFQHNYIRDLQSDGISKNAFIVRKNWWYYYEVAAFLYDADGAVEVSI